MTTGFSFPGFFIDHPISPVPGKDPLSLYTAPSGPDGPAAERVRSRIGYGCLWEPAPERTWSGTALGLREALRGAADIVDIGIHIPPIARMALKGVHTQYRYGRFTTSWCYSRITDAYLARSLRRSMDKNSSGRQCDAALTIDALAILPEPFFVYAYSSWDALISSMASPQKFAEHRFLSTANMRRRRDWQVAVYERATGIIAESHWLARSLVAQSGVPAQKIHVVHPGVLTRGNSNSPSALPHERDTPRRRLLFVTGQEEPQHFYRKGGDLIIGALAILRRDYDPQLTLTIAGIKNWPLPGEPPQGVELVGALPRREISRLYDSHDLFVLPSRLETFGLSLVEALSRGLPCVARAACAMPEIVTPGVSGALISKDDEHELAATIAAALTDDDLYKQCHARAPKIADYFSWDRSAHEVAQIINRTIA